MDVDPLASMRCWALTVELGGREYEIPALPAADWWPVVSDPDASSFLDILKSGPADDLDAQLLDGSITGAELGAVMMDAVAEATGRSFHASFVLATVATSQWPIIGGELAQRGFRWDVMPIGAALDAVYAIVVAGLEEKNREKFLALLEDETLSQPGKKRTPSQRVVGEFESMAGPRPAPAPLPAGASAAPSGSQRPRTRTRPRQNRQDGRSDEPKR